MIIVDLLNQREEALPSLTCTDDHVHPRVRYGVTVLILYGKMVPPTGVPVAEHSPHDQANAGRRRRFQPVCEVAAGLTRLPDWDAESFADERRDLDAAVPTVTAVACQPVTRVLDVPALVGNRRRPAMKMVDSMPCGPPSIRPGGW